MDKLTNEMIKDLAIRLGLEPALLKAVQLVEAAGRGLHAGYRQRGLLQESSGWRKANQERGELAVRTTRHTL